MYLRAIMINKHRYRYGKVVLYCRVSTQVQDYERQVSDLTQFVKKHQWEIAETFAEKLSGAKKNDERKELTSLLSYARVHYINRLLVTELSRLGRDTLQVLAAINMLNKAKVSLYIMNYNIETLTPDGKVNPICLLKSEKLPRKKSINVDIMPVIRKNYNARAVSITDS